MNMIMSGIIATLFLSGAALAEGKMAMDHDAESPAQQSYHTGMESMHSNMMAGLKSTDPDVAFAQGMTAHHQGAIEMAQTELKYGKDPEMRKLAEAIINAQQPEIDRMQAWLKQHKDK